MVFRSVCKILPTIQRTCLIDKILVPVPSIERLAHRATSPRRKEAFLFRPHKYNLKRPNIRFRRLQLLKKQIRFSDDEVKELYKSAPRLGDVKLMDEVLRNIELLLYVYKADQVAWLLRNRITILTQIDHAALMKLFGKKGRRLKIADLIQTMENKTKDVVSVPAKQMSSDSTEESSNKTTECVSDNGNGALLNSTVQEKTEFLYSEGLSREFLQNNDFILKYSMKRLKREIQYVKKELGELDPEVLSSRVKGVPKKVIFYRSRKIAAKMLCCKEKDFTELQTKYLFSLYPGSVKDSIRYLLSLGFTTEDVKSCIYIIGQPKDEIDKARNEIMKKGNIDMAQSQMFVNIILYAIKSKKSVEL